MRFALRRRVHTIALLAVVALLAGLVAGAPVEAAIADGPAPVDRQILDAPGRASALVHVEPSASLPQGLAAARAAGLETGTVYDAIEVFVAYGSAAEFAELARADAIQYVEANRRVRLSTNSSHRATRGQAVLDGAVTLPDGTKIDGRGVGVAVIDSGVDGTHPDLASRMGGNVKIVCTSPLPATNAFLGGFQECRTPKDVVELEDTDTPSAGGHGTHVAGIVAGTGAASNGTYHGAAPGATLYGVSVGTFIAVENGLDGLAWVLDNHDQVAPAIKVVNNSWGSGYRKYAANGDVLYSATWKLQEALIREGVTVVFAAGNAGGNGTTPTTVAECVNPTPGLVCVANYDDKGSGTRAGTISTDSSRGNRTDVESWPDVSAPGTVITSTCRVTLPVCNAHAGFVTNPPNLYASLSGTSMAAPHVAGIAAQLLQADPTLTPAEIEGVLEDTAHKFAFGTAYGLLTDPTNPDNTTSFEKGHGLVDALAAVQAVLGDSTEPTTPPTTSPDPTASPTASPTVAPTTPPTSEPTGGTRYYFHSASGIGNADLYLVDGHPFDTNEPTAGGYSEWHDIPGAGNGAPNGPYDPNWTGTIQGDVTSLTLDFWAKTPVGDALGQVDYNPTVWVGTTAYKLPTLTAEVDPTIGDVPTRLTKTYTTMLDAAGKEVPLSISPGSQPVTISIAGTYAVDEGGSWIVYDYEDYPSGFVVNGNGTPPTESPSPTPTVSPTVDPTTEPTPTPAPGRGTYPADPNDPMFDLQWGMTKIQAPQAWQERNATGFGINIAIVDSGVDLGHPDFACDKLNVLPGSDVSSGDNDPQDTDGHGTHVAGIAGACTNNGTGVVGVAPDSTIIPVRATGGAADLDQSMADGIRFATDNGAHVVNLSIGDIPPFSHFGPDGFPKTEDALEYARSKGVVIAAAAGNFAQPTCEYPSLSRNVICVVATDRDDMRAWYTDFPVNVDRNAEEPGLEPVVAAPGGDGLFCDGGVASTYLRSAASTCYDSGYDSLHGTSMSSPHVAGVAALLYDRIGGERSRANADLIVQTILDTSDDLYSPGWDPIVGYGRVNALAAVRAIDVPEPSATSIAFTDNTSESVQYSDVATFEAELRDTVTGEPVPGAQVTFRMSAGEVAHEFVAVTNEQGVASVTYDGVSDKPGAYDLTARFLGQGDLLLGSADVRSITVQKEVSALALTVSKSKSTGKIATATLTDADAASGVAGRMVEFFAGGTSLGFAMTNDQGVATMDTKGKNAPAGQGFRAVFAGDDHFEGSSATAPG
ncbi:MAG TPA: S8 family serine peptidase [Actinomycetota bacterium]|nr:S8 family serine peptidase [Actinomycetota bacterium]